jgi:hypothetical protein
MARQRITATVYSSHGTFTIDAKTGTVRKLVLDTSDKTTIRCLENIARFKLNEYREWDRKFFPAPRQTPHDIDILHIGWVTKGGRHVRADDEARKNAVKDTTEADAQK